MDDFNKAIVIGRLTRDPEIKYTKNEKAVATLNLAINKKFGAQDQTVFIEVTVWNKMAEVVEQYLHKGSKVLVEGALTFQSWQDHKTGLTRSKI